MDEITKTELNFKNNIINLRKEAKLSKFAVARASGIDYGYYHRIENKTISTNPGFIKLEALARFYNIEVYELFLSSSDKINKKK